MYYFKIAFKVVFNCWQRYVHFLDKIMIFNYFLFFLLKKGLKILIFLYIN